jgi:hypothetical protein
VPRLPLLDTALNLTLPDNDLTRSFDAKLRKSSLEALLVDCLRARAKAAPLLFVLENCHWLDPLSHDLLEVIGRAIEDLPVFLALAYRPPDAQRSQALRVDQLPYFTGGPLDRLQPPGIAERLIHLKLDQFFGAQTEIPRADQPHHRPAQGNPFYIEELLNYFKDRGINPQDSQALERFDLPTSLHSLILSRIDQLIESRRSSEGRQRHRAVVQGRDALGVYPQLGEAERVKADLGTCAIWT